MDLLVLQKGTDGTVWPRSWATSRSWASWPGSRPSSSRRWRRGCRAPRRPHGPRQRRGVLVYENLWAAPFASATRRAGGQVIANGRIPIQALMAAIEADEAATAVGA